MVTKQIHIIISICHHDQKMFTITELLKCAHPYALVRHQQSSRKCILNNNMFTNGIIFYRYRKSECKFFFVSMQTKFPWKANCFRKISQQRKSLVLGTLQKRNIEIDVYINKGKTQKVETISLTTIGSSRYEFSDEPKGNQCRHSLICNPHQPSHLQLHNQLTLRLFAYVN